VFTGIIQHLGRVASIERNSFGAALVIDCGDWNHRANIGDSIATNGCCLTVANRTANGALGFDVIRQTLEATTLGHLKVGAGVNLEQAVTPQTMLGGHIVQGHVDGLGVVKRVQRNATEHRLRIEVPGGQMMEAIVDKGSIAVNGVSLTVAAAGHGWFEVALIPTTLQLTNLGELSEGDRVNLETDYIAKVVVNWLRRRDE